jgi:hypothetical protein
MTFVSLLKRLLNYEQKEELLKKIRKGETVSWEDLNKARDGQIRFVDIVMTEQNEFGATTSTETRQIFWPTLIEPNDALFPDLTYAGGLSLLSPSDKVRYIQKTDRGPFVTRIDFTKHYGSEGISVERIEGPIIDLQEVEDIRIINTGFDDMPITRIIMKPRIRWWNKDKWDKKHKKNKKK